VSDKIDTQYTNEPVCPYCGYKVSNSWELNMRDGDEIERECSYCSENFKILCIVTVEYCTETKAEGRA
jgi:hypothetical protein